jgi:hypothetical protein
LRHLHPIHRPLVLLCTLFATTAPALAADAAVLRCRQLTEAAARLACYDAITVSAVAPKPEARAEKAAPAAEFGRPSPAAAIAAIESSVGPEFEGWRPGARIRLENGQVWLITDDSTAWLDRGRRKVTVRRGALGVYYLDVEGTNQSPRVRRVD